MLRDKGSQQGIQQLHDAGIAVYFEKPVLFDGSDTRIFYIASHDA
jgi:hypothetical protein